MSLLKMLQQAQGGQGLSGLAAQLGLDDAQAGGLAEMLAPAIGSAAKRRAETGGLESLLGQLKGESQGALLDDPVAAAAPEARQQGENFLANLLGSPEATRELAAEAATRSNVDQSKVEEFLPAMAAMLQGGMQKQTPDDSISGMLSQLSPGTGSSSSGAGGLLGMVTGLLGGSSSAGSGGGLDLGAIGQMLDADGDGSPLDDILERVMR